MKGFIKGERVRMTPEGERVCLSPATQTGPKRTVKTGEVAATQRHPHYVSVRLDGNKWATSYHENFWERA
jgi:hypothetical protein